MVSFSSVIYFFIILVLEHADAHLNLTMYKKMPPLHNLDDYDVCLATPSVLIPAPTYCMVYAEIAPDNGSDLWLQVANFSSDRKHYFAHDRLFFGVCLERCQRLHRSLSGFHKDRLYGGAVADKELIAYFADVHKRDTDERVRFDPVINRCLNYDFQLKYNLTLRTSVMYCEVANKPLPLDLLDYVVYGIFASLALLNVLSTIYDYRLKRRQPLDKQNNEFYKKDLRIRAELVLTSFSICRNYYRLTKPSTSSVARDLSFLNAYRAFTTFMVILAHVVLFAVNNQLLNPEFVENYLNKPSTAIMQNGVLIIQVFFLISGFLLSISFHEQKLVDKNTSTRKCIGVYFKIFWNRYLRFLPSLAILILFNSTVLSRLQDGPLWRHFSEAERVYCREYWWKNLLFVNNILMEKSCAHQTWYLAADMQCFELFTILLIVISAYPKTKKPLLTTMFVCAVAVPTLITYFLKLEAVYLMSPENYRYFYFKDVATFYHAYIPFYSNLGGYLFGVIAADIYLKAKSENSLERFKGVLRYELMFWLVFPIAIGTLATGSIFITHDFSKPNLWLALYAGLYKIAWVLICCFCVLSMCHKVGWIAYEFCRLPFFRPLGRISYQAYIWHVSVIRVMSGFYRQPIYVNVLSLLTETILLYVVSNIVAMVFAIILEFPCGALMKSLFARKSNDPDNFEIPGKIKEVPNEVDLRTLT